MNPFVQQLRNSPLAGNIGSLLVIQLLNYLIPVIVIPVLVNNLGDGNYGIMAFAQYFSGILIFVCDYGFVYTGPQQVSQNQNNPVFLSKLFSSITTIRGFFFLLSIPVTILFCFAANLSPIEKEAVYISLLGVAGNVLTPFWFLQGYQKLRAITIVNVVFKVLQLVLLMVCITQKTGLALACWIFFGCNFLLGLVSFIYTLYQFKLKLFVPRLAMIRDEMKKGFHMFLAVFFSSVYINGTGLLLGLITDNNHLVGHYSAAEKIVRAVTYLFNPLIMAFFPFVSKMFVMNRDMGLMLFFKFMRIVGILAAVATLVLFLSAGWLVNLLLDESFVPSILLIAILSPVVLAGNMGNMLGNNLFIQLGWQRVTVVVVLLLALVNTVMCLLLCPGMGATGAATALVITECLAPILFGAYYLAHKNRI